MNSLMAGKRGIIFGVANDKSIAWFIASALKEAGARLVLTYQGDVMEKRVRPLGEKLGVDGIFSCDVEKQDTLESVFQSVSELWDGELDFIVHAVAFSDKNELSGMYLETSRANFLRTMDISCFSFTAVMQLALPLMQKAGGGAAITLSYYGSEKVIPNYNVMGVAKAALESSVRYLAADLGKFGIRVNALSAGPVRTLAASGISGFRKLLDAASSVAPMRRNVVPEDLGGSALYLLSGLSSGVTGTTHYVDSGYHVLGMTLPNTSDALKEE